MSQINNDDLVKLVAQRSLSEIKAALSAYKRIAETHIAKIEVDERTA